MVLRVGRRLLGHEQDAEDVFQAAFLVLARKARSTHWQPSIGNWLYGVAHRLAREMRTRAARLRKRPAGMNPRPAADPLDEWSVREAQVILEEELSRLPEKFRAPLVLCGLEGLAREEAARHLGWPASLVKSRLEQGRERLTWRLARRGLSLSAALAATFLTEGTAPAAVAPALAHSTLRAAVAFGAGTTTGTISAPAVALAEGALPTVSALNGRMLASGSWDRTIRLWDPDTGEERRALRGHTDTIYRLAFAPDGRRLASASFDGSVRLWDPAAGKERHCLRGHNGYVFTVAFSPDGRTLASGGADGTVRLWDPASGKELNQFKGSQREIQKVAVDLTLRVMPFLTRSVRSTLFFAGVMALGIYRASGALPNRWSVWLSFSP